MANFGKIDCSLCLGYVGRVGAIALFAFVLLGYGVGCREIVYHAHGFGNVGKLFVEPTDVCFADSSCCESMTHVGTSIAISIFRNGVSRGQAVL